MQQRCPTCGAALMPDAPTCPACGALLDSHEAMPPEAGPLAPASPPEAAPTRQAKRRGRASDPREERGHSQRERECGNPVSASARRRRRGRLFVLLSLGILLLLVGAGAGTFLLSAHRPSSSASRPPLYANNLTANQRAWQCQPGATCQFETNGLHILAPTDHLYFSVLSGQSFDDQVINVQGKLDNGDPQFVGLAIAFRSVGVDGYGWLVFANGDYELVEWDPQGNASYLIPLTPSPAIHRGLNQINKLTIIANHDQITLIINGQRLAQIIDDTYTSGNLLLGAARTFADAVFANLSVTRP